MSHETAFLAIFYDDVMLDARSANSNPEGSAAGYAHARRSHGHAFALTIGGGVRVVRALFGTVKKPSGWLEFPGSFARSRSIPRRGIC